MTKSTKAVSVKGVAKAALREDKKARDASVKTPGSPVLDSFVNFNMKMGIGADNPLSTASYGFNPITRIRQVLEWIHRGSWLGGVAVDLVADDMTRAGVDLLGDQTPEEQEKIEESMVHLGVWNAINETIKWDRLYGGCIAVTMIDGQDVSTPLRVESVGKGQFKGLLVLDRWMVEPSLNNLVKVLGPDLGLPKFYDVRADAPALRSARIHHSRCMRLDGIKMPYWQRIQENLWGISVLERLYDRMVAFDSATTGAAQLVYKAYIRTYAVKDLRTIIAGGGPALEGLVKYVEMMRRFQSIEGMTLLDAEDKMEAMGHTAFAGLSDALIQFGQQLSGALQIPLVRLFGQSPSGMNSTGESDLRTYYDNIKQQQEKTLRIPLTRIYRVAAQSEGVKLKDGFRIDFRSLWQLSEKEKAEIAEITARAVGDAEDRGLITQKGAMKELQESSQITGIFNNITDADISGAEDTLPPAGEEAIRMEQEAMQAAAGAGAAPDKNKKKEARDSAITSVGEVKRIHDLDVVIETPKGAIRRGEGWEVVMPAHYGYLRMTTGDDGEQVDCYLGPDLRSDKVWVIKQVDANTKQPDEDKVMLGFSGPYEVMTTYLSGFSDGRGWDRIGGMDLMSMDQFKAYLATHPYRLPSDGVRT